MNNEPLSHNTHAYPYSPYSNYSPYGYTQFTPTPPPEEQHKRLSLLKMNLAVVFMLALMAFSGLGGYVVHGMGSTPSQRRSRMQTYY